MDIHNSLHSSSSLLNEQVARQMFQILPEGGPMMVIFDRHGNCWPSDTEAFGSLGISQIELREICSRIDDGQEPVMTQIGDHSVVATQLATDHTNCGYIIVALPQHSPEATLANSELIEIVLNQTGLILKLIERNNRLFQRRSLSPGGHERDLELLFEPANTAS